MVKKILILILLLVLLIGIILGAFFGIKHFSKKQVDVKTSLPESNIIPKKIINATQKDDYLADTLFADKKVVYYMRCKDCPVMVDFGNKMDEMFKQLPEDVRKNYIYMPETVSKVIKLSCKGDEKKCWQLFLYERCSQGVCIINPKNGEFLMLYGLDIQAHENSLKKYKDW